MFWGFWPSSICHHNPENVHKDPFQGSDLSLAASTLPTPKTSKIAHFLGSGHHPSATTTPKMSTKAHFWGSNPSLATTTLSTLKTSTIAHFQGWEFQPCFLCLDCSTFPLSHPYSDTINTATSAMSFVSGCFSYIPNVTNAAVLAAFFMFGLCFPPLPSWLSWPCFSWLPPDYLHRF